MNTKQYPSLTSLPSTRRGIGLTLLKFICALSLLALSCDAGIFLKFDDDSSIQGDSTDPAHKKWIQCTSFQFGVGRGVSTPVGPMGSRETSAPNVSEIIVTKLNDTATVALLKEALVGEPKKITIEFTRTNGTEKPVVYQKIVLFNTLISGYSTSSSSSASRPTESISLNFVKIEITNPLTEKTTTYDIGTGTAN